jgi:hypothetical protein
MRRQRYPVLRSALRDARQSDTAGRHTVSRCRSYQPELFDLKTIALYSAAYRKIRRAKPGMVFVSEASRLDFITELRWLFSNAASFILPGLLEGFGLPALEAGRS